MMVTVKSIVLPATTRVFPTMQEYAKLHIISCVLVMLLVVVGLASHGMFQERGARPHHNPDSICLSFLN